MGRDDELDQMIQSVIGARIRLSGCFSLRISTFSCDLLTDMTEILGISIYQPVPFLHSIVFSLLPNGPGCFAGTTRGHMDLSCKLLLHSDISAVESVIPLHDLPVLFGHNGTFNSTGYY